LVLTGGEPTVNKDLDAILRFAHTEYPRMSIRLITNAIHLPPKLLDSLLLGNVVSVHVSMNASNATDYRRITGVDKFDQVLRNVRSLLAKRDDMRSPVPTACGSLVLVKENLSNVIPSVHLGHELGFDAVYILEPYLPAELSGSSPFGDRKQLDGIFQEARAIASDKGIMLVLPEMGTRAAKIDRCTEPWRKIWVSAGGWVNPCCGYNFGVSGDNVLRGNLLKQDLREFWYGGIYEALRVGLTRKDPVPGCKACYSQMFAEQ
ncbi:MAG: radical SAM protein, partial [Phycisphaerae bacterium]